MQSAQVMPTTGYNGTVYAPFDASAPSEQSEANTNQAPGRMGHIRKGLIGGPEDPFGPSPIGEPWVMAIFALAFAGVVALRKTKKSQDYNGKTMSSETQGANELITNCKQLKMPAARRMTVNHSWRKWRR